MIKEDEYEWYPSLILQSLTFGDDDMLLNGRKIEEPYATFYIGLKYTAGNRDHGKKKKKKGAAAQPDESARAGLLGDEDEADTQRDAINLDDDDIFEGVQMDSAFQFKWKIKLKYDRE